MSWWPRLRNAVERRPAPPAGSSTRLAGPSQDRGATRVPERRTRPPRARRLGPSARVSRRCSAARGCGRSGARVISAGCSRSAADATRCASARGAGGCSAPPWASRDRPVDSARRLGAAPGPQQQRLHDLHAAQPLLGHRQRTAGEQPAADAQRARALGGRLAGEPVVVPALGEQQQRADDRDHQQRQPDDEHAHPERGGGEPDGGVVDRVDVPRVDAEVAEQVEQRAPPMAPIAGDRGERQRREAQPRPVQPGELLHRDGGRRGRRVGHRRRGSGRAARGAGGRPRPC